MRKTMQIALHGSISIGDMRPQNASGDAVMPVSTENALSVDTSQTEFAIVKAIESRR
ncbi:MAG: hypothetical protein RXR20_17105 [Paraburkholderia sp.]|uniref:hypothetical protein n=1 Tax=Burkholderiaceae TaxID=119060 RepID=UPI0014851836|nr:hypothetical protein [Burkholderia sp. 4M9327F10]